MIYRYILRLYCYCNHFAGFLTSMYDDIFFIFVNAEQLILT